VEEFARAGRGTRGKVAGLHQGNVQPAGGRVERCSGTGDPAPDDQDVQVVVGQPPPRSVVLVRTESGIHHILLTNLQRA
jgi:hypothetical protein